MFDSKTALADLDAAVVLLCAHLTQIAETKDAVTSNVYRTKLHHLLNRAISTHKRASVPDNWKHYCGHCGFEREPNAPGKLQCPQCGEGLRVLNLDKGEVVIRRQYLVIAETM